MDGTLAYWSGVRADLGYLPRMVKANGKAFSWTRLMELGAYAHLIKLAAFRQMDMEGMSEVDLIVQQRLEKTLPHRPLPSSVLDAQGLQ